MLVSHALGLLEYHFCSVGVLLALLTPFETVKYLGVRKACSFHIVTSVNSFM